MTDIANQLTFDGLADGTPITTAATPATTVASGNSKGTGVTWTIAGLSTSPSIVTEGHGVRMIAASQTARFDGTFASATTAFRGQCRFTRGAAITGAHMPIVGVRTGTNGATALSNLMLGTDNLFYGQAPTGQFNSPLTGNAGTGAVGDLMLLDFVFTLNATPSGANSRLFYREKNLSNPSWDTDGEYFYDSLYTRDLGTAAFTQVRFGVQAGSIASPGLLMEYMGLEAITVNPAHTTEAQAKAYFADAPVDTVTLPAVPNLTVSPTRPTTPGGTDGKALITFGTVSGAAGGYEVQVAPGTGATTGFGSGTTATTTSREVLNLPAGNYTARVRAKA